MGHQLGGQGGLGQTRKDEPSITVWKVFEGLRQALNSSMTRVAPGLHICPDNLGVARNAGEVPKGSSQKSCEEV